MGDVIVSGAMCVVPLRALAAAQLASLTREALFANEHEFFYCH
jgi:hypothetical protein